MILDEVLKAGSYLFIAWIVHVPYWLAVKASGTLFRVLLKGFLWCAVIALIAAFTLGNPTCIVQDDPLYGGCAEYADDGYEPTSEQMIAKFGFTMTLLYVPAIIGAFNRSHKVESKENWKHQTPVV
jgi:hypothetical protein